MKEVKICKHCGNTFERNNENDWVWSVKTFCNIKCTNNYNSIKSYTTRMEFKRKYEDAVLKGLIK